MDDLNGEEGRNWRTAFDLVVWVAMLMLAFAGIGASDVSGAGSQTYWSVLAVGFGLAAFAVDWVHADEDFHWGRDALLMAGQWIGVLAAVQLVYLFIASGRLANADAGLVNGLVLALGTFLCGVRANWRLMVIGATIAFATAAVAYLEQYLWVLFGLAIVALAVIVLVTRARSRSPTA